MSSPGPDEAHLATVVRSALAATEPEHVPHFDHVWSRASRRRAAARTGWLRPAWVAATIVAAVTAAWLGWPRPVQDADEDYRLAVALVADAGLGTPTDRWLAEAPKAPLRGLPILPAVRYPLLPEENFL